MLPLVVFIGLVIVVLVLIEIRERRRAKNTDRSADRTQSKEHRTDSPVRPDGCCGEHLVCERETLLQTNAKIEYYDDEELDVLAGIDPSHYTAAQRETIREVFSSLQESDVPGWCRSLQLRNITLPPDIREEALLIVRERRHIA